MSYKKGINKIIGAGLALFVILAVVSWQIIPAAEAPSQGYGLRWLFVYSIPLFFGVYSIALKRYSSEDLVKGYLSKSGGIELEQAYMQNTVEQTLIALPLVISFSVMAPLDLSKALPVHAVLFLTGRMMFYWGYRTASALRIPGFIITNYANVTLLLGCIYLALFLN